MPHNDTTSPADGGLPGITRWLQVGLVVAALVLAGPSTHVPSRH